MFHSTPSYSSEMTSVAGTAGSYHQTTANTTANTPVYVPSNRAISHAQYGHAGSYTNAAQNGWSAEGTFGEFLYFFVTST